MVMVMAVMVMLMMMMIMVVALVGMSVSVKVFRESDFEVHSARDSINGRYADCSIFANREALGLGTDRGAIFWNGGCVFGVHSWC